MRYVGMIFLAFHFSNTEKSATITRGHDAYSPSEGQLFYTADWDCFCRLPGSRPLYRVADTSFKPTRLQ